MGMPACFPPNDFTGVPVSWPLGLTLFPLPARNKLRPIAVSITDIQQIPVKAGKEVGAMSQGGQVNVNTPSGGGGGSGAAVAVVVIVLIVVVLLILWFTGVLNFGGTSTVNVNVNSELLQLLAA